MLPETVTGVARNLWQDYGRGRLAQLVARFLHTEEVIGSSPVSPTYEFSFACLLLVINARGTHTSALYTTHTITAVAWATGRANDPV